MNESTMKHAINIKKKPTRKLVLSLKNISLRLGDFAFDLLLLPFLFLAITVLFSNLTAKVTQKNNKKTYLNNFFS